VKITHSLCFVLLIVLLQAIVSCSGYKIAEHFHPYDNDTLIYRFTKDSASITIAYNDTLVCKMMVRRGVILTHSEENRVIFYYQTSASSHDSQNDIFTSDIPLNQFSYCLDEGNLYMDNSIPVLSNKMIVPMKKLLPKKVKTGNTYEFKNGDYQKRYSLVSTEDLNWGPMFIKNTLKFAISFRSRQGFRTTDTIWMAKKWGIVKWKKANGYLGELLY
jgi:hypothetical protein